MGAQERGMRSPGCYTGRWPLADMSPGKAGATIWENPKGRKSYSFCENWNPKYSLGAAEDWGDCSDSRRRWLRMQAPRPLPLSLNHHIGEPRAQRLQTSQAQWEFQLCPSSGCDLMQILPPLWPLDSSSMKVVITKQRDRFPESEMAQHFSNRKAGWGGRAAGDKGHRMPPPEHGFLSLGGLSAGEMGSDLPRAGLRWPLPGGTPSASSGPDTPGPNRCPLGTAAGLWATDLTCLSCLIRYRKTGGLWMRIQ